MPIYKPAKWKLVRAITSCLCQTYSNYELILIDDNDNQDYVVEFINSVANENERVKVIHQKNLGVSKSRNAGMEHSLGKWLCFIDTDDWIEKDMLEKMQMLASNDNDLVNYACSVSVGNSKKSNAFFQKVNIVMCR